MRQTTPTATEKSAAMPVHSGAACHGVSAPALCGTEDVVRRRHRQVRLAREENAVAIIEYAEALGGDIARRPAPGHRRVAGGRMLARDRRGAVVV